MADDSPVTDLLHAWSDGNPQALSDLMAVVYTELRALSRSALARERVGNTLDPTALVHEVYLKLLTLKKVSWENRTPFFAFASRLMRRVLVEHARAVRAQKRGGAAHRVDIELVDVPDHRDPVDILELDTILSDLQEHDPFLVQLIELRFFSGLTEAEAATALGVNRTRVQREWRVGKRLLAQRLTGQLKERP